MGVSGDFRGIFWEKWMSFVMLLLLKIIAVVLAIQFFVVGVVFVYWMAIEGYHGALNIARWTKRKVVDWAWGLAHRTTRRFHIVKIRSLMPGYHDTDTRILHSMMNLVVDHVEISLAIAIFNENAENLT